MRRTTMYLHLYHGRTNPDEQLDDWGAEGPVLRIEGFHVTYMCQFRVGVPDEQEDWVELVFVEDLLYYDGMFYGDWSIFAEGTDPHLAKLAVDFDITKLEVAQ